jgi:hypothetical protein
MAQANESRISRRFRFQRRSRHRMAAMPAFSRLVRKVATAKVLEGLKSQGGRVLKTFLGAGSLIFIKGDRMLP